MTRPSPLRYFAALGLHAPYALIVLCAVEVTGMWGIALGPITGQLLAQAVLKGEAPPELAPFDPLR